MHCGIGYGYGRSIMVIVLRIRGKRGVEIIKENPVGCADMNR
jgi:hypothetical protein